MFIKPLSVNPLNHIGACTEDAEQWDTAVSLGVKMYQYSAVDPRHTKAATLTGFLFHGIRLTPAYCGWNPKVLCHEQKESKLPPAVLCKPVDQCQWWFPPSCWRRPQCLIPSCSRASLSVPRSTAWQELRGWFRRRRQERSIAWIKLCAGNIGSNTQLGEIFHLSSSLPLKK